MLYCDFENFIKRVESLNEFESYQHFIFDYTKSILDLIFYVQQKLISHRRKKVKYFNTITASLIAQYVYFIKLFSHFLIMFHRHEGYSQLILLRVLTEIFINFRLLHSSKYQNQFLKSYILKSISFDEKLYDDYGFNELLSKNLKRIKNQFNENQYNQIKINPKDKFELAECGPMYVTHFALPSHFTHGYALDILRNHLTEKEQKFFPLMEDSNNKPDPIIYLNHLNIEMTMEILQVTKVHRSIKKYLLKDLKNFRTILRIYAQKYDKQFKTFKTE